MKFLIYFRYTVYTVVNIEFTSEPGRHLMGYNCGTMMPRRLTHPSTSQKYALVRVEDLNVIHARSHDCT